MLAPDLEAWLKSDGTSNRSRVTNVATLSARGQAGAAGGVDGRAVASLIKDREALLAFYDFPAEHWKHLRTTNVIESAFATVRHRTVRTKGCLL